MCILHRSEYYAEFTNKKCNRNKKRLMLNIFILKVFEGLGEVSGGGKETFFKKFPFPLLLYLIKP